MYVIHVNEIEYFDLQLLDYPVMHGYFEPQSCDCHVMHGYFEPNHVTVIWRIILQVNYEKLTVSRSHTPTGGVSSHQPDSTLAVGPSDDDELVLYRLAHKRVSSRTQGSFRGFPCTKHKQGSPDSNSHSSHHTHSSNAWQGHRSNCTHSFSAVLIAYSHTHSSNAWLGHRPV